ncbi:hypothetical protein [Parasphingorhabdus sp.]|uniref:hypothetical protein n=1 Tax=Parasphingorhabdus sp. TaxID=2709688 RepID=UPI002B26E8DF|nr:hypothetical protein [Parasphingorhabdus sp.]|tara:strand:+ start:989 stop:1456 length:468 start_codon:yes stop_codon:yes gene_type:complete
MMLIGRPGVFLSFLLMFCAPFAEAGVGKLAADPPSPIIPKLIQPFSRQAHEALALELEAARNEALESKQIVTHLFVVGWELHEGYFLSEPGAAGSFISPDFADERVRGDFDRQTSNAVLAEHVGQKLICECTGVAWSFHSAPRFVVQSAKLSWSK